MAIRTLINDINNDFNNTANWTGATVPVTGDTILCSEGNHEITTNVAFADHGVEHAIIQVEDQFTGQMGTAANPFELDNTGGNSTLVFDGPRTRDFHLDCNLDSAYVMRTHHQRESLSIQGGTTTLIVVGGGTGLVLGAGGTFTTVEINGPGVDVNIEDGNVITTLIATIGDVHCSTQVTTTKIYAGTVWLQGETKTFALIELNELAGACKLECDDSIITLLKAVRGMADGRMGRRPITITDAEAHFGGRLWYGRHIIETNNAQIFGAGDYRGFGTPDMKYPTYASATATGAGAAG